MAQRPPVVDEAQKKFFQDLAGPNFAITASIYQGLHEATGGDADKMTDELMNMMNDPFAEEKKRAEQRNREIEMQRRAAQEEADKRKRDEAERVLREEVARRLLQEKSQELELIRQQEEAFRVIARQNEEKRKKEEENARLAELQRKNTDEDQRKLEEEIQRRLVEARKKREEEEVQRLKELEAKKVREEQARRFAEEALRYAEQEREQKLKQKEAELQAAAQTQAQRAAAEVARLQAEAQKRAEADAQKRAEAEAQKRAEIEAEERVRRRVEEEMRRSVEDERKKKEAAEAKMRAAAEEHRLREEVERRLRLEDQQKASAAAAAAASAAAPAPAASTSVPASPQSQSNASDRAAKEQSINEMRAVYDQKLKELEDRLLQYDRKIQIISAPSSASASAPASPATPTAASAAAAAAPVPPIVCVLVDNDTAPAKVEEVTAFLASKGVRGADVRVVNATNDFELVQVVKGQRDTLQYPSIIIRQQAVGTLEELKQYAQKIGVLEALLAGEKVDLAAAAGKKEGAPTPPELKLGLYDYSISATEFTLKTVGTLVFLPIIAPYKLLTWAFGGKQPELAKGEDIDVIQSNWYWRHQLRTVRFMDDHMLRLRPGYNDVRAAHKYDDVKEIRVIDATNLVISYKTGGADYLRTTPADVKRICDIIAAKNKQLPPIVKS